MHTEVRQLTEAGIRVRYLLFPRAGLGSDSHRKAVAVWCAKDQQRALTHAKAGNDPGKAKCQTPIANNIERAERMGLRGTPFSILDNGAAVFGYREPKKWLELLGEQTPE